MQDKKDKDSSRNITPIKNKVNKSDQLFLT